LKRPVEPVHVPPVTTIDLNGIAISRLGLADAVERCRERIATGAGGFACFVNAHTLTHATKHVALREALTGATYCFADGVPLLWLARAKRAPIADRVCGPDFADAMLRCEPTMVHGFIGGHPGRAHAVARAYLVPAVVHVPPMRAFSAAAAREDWAQFLAACPGGVPPPIVWVGLGAPKQELWLDVVSRLAPGVMFFGVGAAFDFLSRAVPRAPHVMQRLGLEWAHRVAREPRRLWRRYLVANTQFVPLAVRELSAAPRARSRLR
jgi:N-acetylglucosaminyldiphosphoundecaprenol N-acetyl-beta-D-mannosaminyltransferase